MKLYSVLVGVAWVTHSEDTVFVVAECIEMAKEKALESGYYDMAQATEVNVEGYKIVLERVEDK